MKYWVMIISNGELQLGEGKVTEHTTIESAHVKFCNVCASMWNAPDVITGYVVIFDAQFTIIDTEFIHHDAPSAQPAPEPTEG